MCAWTCVDSEVFTFCTIIPISLSLYVVMYFFKGLGFQQY